MEQRRKQPFGYKGFRTRFSGVQQWLQDNAGLKYCGNRNEYGNRINALIVPFLKSKGAKVYKSGDPLASAELNAKYVSAHFQEFTKFIKEPKTTTA